MESSSRETVCPSGCGTVFKGSLGNRISNLQRHMKSVHRQGPPLVCMVENCGKTYQRSDYLTKHYRKAHNFPPDVVECEAAQDESLHAD